MNAPLRLVAPSPSDRIEAAEAAFRAAAQRRGHKVADDLATLDHMAVLLAKAIRDAGKAHATLGPARLVREGYVEKPGDFDPFWIAESLREAMNLSPEGHAVLAARMDQELTLAERERSEAA